MPSESSEWSTVANMSWVLLFVFCFIIQTPAIKQTSEFNLHGIVRPKILHSLHEKGMENDQTEEHGKEETYISEVQYLIKLNGEEIILHLQKAKHVTVPYCTETHHYPKGEEITRSSQNMFQKHCYYEGHILNEKDSFASISTCDGLRGCFTRHGQRYLIEPLQSSEQSEHAVLTQSQEESDVANCLSSVRRAGRKQGRSRTSRSLNSKEPGDFLQEQKYIDLFLVLDNAFYKMYNGNLTVIRSFLSDVLNLLNVMYNTIDVHVALVGMEIWSDGDKIKVEPNIGKTYSTFLQWHRSTLGNKKIHDHAQLLSGIGFYNRRVGMANSNSLCSSASIAVIEGINKNSVALAAVMAHELGHVLGMPDIPYTTKCPSGSCVMSQYLSSKFPKGFSTICRSQFQKYILSQKPKCLLQAPSPKNIITKPVCGNQLLEVGEDCDCGSPKKCTDLCCEALTCKLRSGPDCREDTADHITK